MVAFFEFERDASPLVENLGRLKTFAYLDSERAPLYRSIMRAFVAAKERFGLHLRPAEVARDVAHADRETLLPDVDGALKQLCEWGNLRGDPDTADVATVEDFYRERLLYQLTPEGEAAERAVRLYVETLEQPGELQTAALTDIREHLGELERLAQAAEVDSGKVYRTLEGQSTDSRSDQFSFAVTCWEILYGSLPFRGDEIDAIRSAVLAQQIEPLPGDTTVPRAVSDALRRAMRVSPSARYASLSDLLEKLSHAAR